ncbi:MAG: hypothetical protein LBC80_03490 [Treponema sp.]|jgi:uncharacterized protein YsxB (DUF464 family)|nr:hypothetical protein [Treponema sp.]
MNFLHIVSIVCFSLCLIMFFYLNWLIKKRTVGSTLDERRDEFLRLIAEIDRVTDRDVQIVEDRVKKLNEIKEEVDKRIAVYVKELEKSRSGEALYTSLGKGIRDALNAPLSEVETAQDFPLDTIELSPQAATASKVGAPSNVMPSLPLFETPVITATIEPETPVSPPTKKQIRSHIDILCDEGLSMQQIASRLNISIGEVELAINLRRGK